MKTVGLYILLFLGFFLLFSSYRQENLQKEIVSQIASLQAYPKNTIKKGNVVYVDIQNKSDKPLILGNENTPPFEITFQNEKITFEDINITPFWPKEIAPNETYRFSLDRWNNQIFSKSGIYTISLLSQSINEEKISTEITIKERGFLGHIWNTLLYRPIYNVLIYVTTTLPDKSLGWGIIILTVLIRIILLIPNQRALESQKKLQKLQPIIQELQKKYADDKVKLSQETMELWKKHKVNPFGSCLPILIQLPILIALYYVIQDGLLYTKTVFLYPPIQNIDIGIIDSNFLGILPLDKPEWIFLPITLMILQYFQLKLANIKRPQIENSDMPDPMKTMVYVMPVMIGVMSATFPAGLSLYWGISTIFGIGQQLLVNREKQTQMG